MLIEVLSHNEAERRRHGSEMPPTDKIPVSESLCIYFISDERNLTEEALGLVNQYQAIVSDLTKEALAEERHLSIDEIYEHLEEVAPSLLEEVRVLARRILGTDTI